MSVTVTLNPPVGRLAVTAIRLYRRFISPYKGFRCAHHALHRQGSCSHYGLHMFQQHPPREAWRLTRARLRDCTHAYLTIRVQQGQEQQRRRDRGTAGNCLMPICETIACIDLTSCAISDCL